MTNIKLDFSNCNYIMAVYEYIKKQFKLPDYCTNNLDAFWDFLDGDDCPRDSKIEIYGIRYLNKNFNGYGEKIKQLFEDLAKEYGNEDIEVLSKRDCLTKKVRQPLFSYIRLCFFISSFKNSRFLSSIS